MPSTPRALGFVVASAFRADPWRATAACVLTPAVGLAAAAAGWWLKLLVDAVAAHRAGPALLAAAALGATAALITVAVLALAKLRFRLQERTGLLLERRLLELVAGLPGLEHHERPEYLDRLEHLRTERSSLGQATGTVAMSAATAVQTLATVALLSSVHPILLLLPLLGLPTLLTSARSAAVVDRAKHTTATQHRLTAHYLAMATTLGPAKELRLYGLGQEVVHRVRTLGEHILRVRVRAQITDSTWQATGGLVSVVGYLTAIAFVIHQAGQGLATTGEVVLTIQLAAQITGNVTAMAATTQQLREVLLVAGHFLWFIDHTRSAYTARRRVTPLARLDRGIALDNVTFHYPNAPTPVLREVNLFLPAGTVVALVGDNGAGKSTLVKLLCGFYQPTHGRITVDDLDLADIAPSEWHATLSGAFQDYCTFEFTAQHSVGVGDIPSVDQPHRVADAANQTGTTAVINALPDGLATQLGRTFHGVDLSQGQWQKLALARSRMRHTPLLYLLDEPTASLDAASETELFTQITRNGRQAAASGAITLLVSHRLSTVRNADLIVVLQHGRITEVGTHTELMDAHKLYAELFTLQSSAYR